MSDTGLTGGLPDVIPTTSPLRALFAINAGGPGTPAHTGGRGVLWCVCVVRYGRAAQSGDALRRVASGVMRCGVLRGAPAPGPVKFCSARGLTAATAASLLPV